MKIKQLLAGSILGVALFSLAPGASAVTLDFSSSTYLGYEQPGHPADAASVAGYVNFLITLSVNGTGTDGSGNTYVRSGNAFNNLGTAVPTFDFGTSPAQVTLDGSLQYLTAHYGNGAQVVWDVLGLVGTFDVMQNGGVAGNGLSGVLGFDGSSTTNVPDGGSTVLLLGSALSGLGLIVRRFKK